MFNEGNVNDYSYSKLGTRDGKQYLQIGPIAYDFVGTSQIELYGCDEVIMHCLKFFELGSELDVIFNNKGKTYGGKLLLSQRKAKTKTDYNLRWNTGVDSQNGELTKAIKENIVEEQEFFKNIYVDDNISESKFDQHVSFFFEKDEKGVIEIKVLNTAKLTEGFDKKVAIGEDVKNDTNMDLIGIGNYLLTLDTILKVPAYQRDFVWAKSQIEALFNDIIETVKKGKSHYHYMGSIYLYEGNIVDGQQRLTTILLCLLMTLNDEDQQKLMINGEYKIKFTDYVNMYWKEYFKNNKTETPNNISQVTLNEPINAIIDGLKECEANDISIEDVVDCIKNHLLISINDLSENNLFNLNEIEVFESLNNRGKSLNSYELIRSLLVQDSQDKFNVYTLKIEERGQENPIANADKLQGYFRHYVAIETGKLSDISLSSDDNIYRGYSKYLMSTYNTLDLGTEDFTKEIENIKKYFNCFDEILNSDNFLVKWLLFVQEELIEIIAVLKLEHPESFKDNVENLVNYVLRVLLDQDKFSSYTSTSIAHKLIGTEIGVTWTLKEQIFAQGNYNKYRIDSDIDKYRDTKNSVAKKILSLYAHKAFDDNVFKIMEKEPVEVEHIFPQSKAKNIEGINRIYRTLGNTSLLEKNINGSKKNGDSDYKEKKEYYNDSKMKISKHILSEFTSDEITEVDIKNRNNKIYEELLERYFRELNLK